jgi:hypothetical protein
MTSQEKILYHQIHPLKLFTDISAEFVSLYLFWRHKLIAGLIVMFVPPIIASLLIIELVNLETYKQSAFGRYIRIYMTPSVVIVRLLGTVLTEKNPPQATVASGHVDRQVCLGFSPCLLKRCSKWSRLSKSSNT